MTEGMNENVAALLPEVALAAAAVAGLLAGGWLPRHRQWPVRALAAAACVFGLIATAAAVRTRPQLIFGAAFAVDTLTDAARLIVLAALLLLLCLSVDTIAGDKRETEFYVLLLLASAGTLILAGAHDLLLLFAGYLLASVPSYALAGFARTATNTEAALKYYLLGALLGVVMLAGITLLYGVAGGTGYPELSRTLTGAPPVVVAAGVVAVLTGLLFKMGAVPAQFWVPDATDGTPAPVAAFLTTIPKVGGLIAGYRLILALPPGAGNWPLLIAVLAAASMTLGNLAAFSQTGVQRLLGYSTISQVGYLLMAVAVAGRSGLAQRALLFYLAAYAVTNLGAFAVVAELPHARTLTDYRGLAHRRPGLAAVLLVCLLGLVGTPPTAVFLGKVEIFTAAIDGGYGWLAALAVANTVASLYYYLRWLAPMFRPDPAAAQPAVPRPAGRWATLAAYSAGTASVALGMLGGLVLHLGTGAVLR